MDCSASPPVIGMTVIPSPMEMVQIEEPNLKSTNLFACSICQSDDACNILSQCLHSVCNECMSKLSTIDGIMCCKCNELNDKVIFNNVMCKLNTINKTPVCEWCCEGGDSSDSVGFCVQCKQWLCAECIKGHNRMPPFRQHTTTIVADNANTCLKCETHPRESLELFCETCGVLTCRDCQLSIHRNHGGHRWLSEKAAVLKPSLFKAVGLLEDKSALLSDAASIARCTSTQGLRESVSKVKLALKKRAEALIEAVNARTKQMEAEIDEKASDHIYRLTKAEALMDILQDRISFALKLTGKLLENVDSDPASLVQLSMSLQSRLSSLTDQAQALALDTPIRLSKNEENENQDFAKKRKDNREIEMCEAQGWRSSAAARVIHLNNREPEELARLSTVVCWMAEKLPNKLKKRSTSEDENSSDEKRRRNSGYDKEDDVSEKYDEDSEFLDSLAELDRPSNCLKLADGLINGCAVCLCPGILAFCVKCRRCYHPDCHLPPIDNPSDCFQHLVDKNASDTEGCWMCSLCLKREEEKKKTKNRVNGMPLNRRVRDFKSIVCALDKYSEPWTAAQFDAGCCILLNLLSHPEAVYFTSSICPICCRPVISLNDKLEVDNSDVCKSGRLFHQFARIRTWLDSARLGQQQQHGIASVDGKPKKKLLLKKFTVWICELDDFMDEVSKANSKKYLGITHGLIKSAECLRGILDESVESFYPVFFDTSISS